MQSNPKPKFIPMTKTPTPLDRTPRFAWQTNPTYITTPRVQLWTRNGTMAGVIPSELAVQKVNDKTHYVISCQAIGEI